MRKHRFSGFATLALGVLLLGSSSAVIAEEKRAFTVDDMLDLVEVGDVVMTPDGSRVFYSERRLNWETNKYEKSLMMISAEGGTAVPFVRKDGGEQFRVSPDGRYLSMLREVDERPQVFLMPLDGGEPRQWTEHRGKIIDYRWSGDGKSIVFVAEEAMGEAEEKEFKLGADPIFVNEGPNGKNHGRWTHLWRIDVDSKTVEQVTESELLIEGFDVSPDGTRVVFAARSDNRGNFPFMSELYIVQADGSDLERLTYNGALEQDPVWAPDGGTFAFHASDDTSFELRNGYLWVLNPDTGELKKLDGQNTGDMDNLVWTPDGTSLLFNEVHGTNTNLYRVDVTTGRLEAMTHATGTLQVESYSRDRTKIVYVLSDCVTPPDLYSADVHGGNPVRLTRANPWAEENIILPSCRVIQWEGHDGLRLEGIFMLPGGHRPGTRVPMILQIHGGPAGSWGNRFEPELIVSAGLGYAQLAPNPRGSSGYGDAVLRGLMAEVGGAEYHDLMIGVDHVVDEGFVDPARLGVSGWSWGGVSAGWIITQTDRFKAASVGAGVSNWIGESGPGFNWDVSTWYIGGKHWTHRNEWRGRSAINFVENVQTPTLFLHGEKDQTSSTNQSMVFFDALQERGVPTRFIKFPRQGHGISEPRLLRTRMVEEIRWMHMYVLGEDWSPAERSR